jgi:hypothetical protein
MPCLCSGHSVADSRIQDLSPLAIPVYEHRVELNGVAAQSLEHGTLQDVLRYAVTVPRAASARGT